MSKRTVRELIVAQAALEHEKTIYSEVVEFLGGFLPTEANPTPDRKMVTQGMGDVPQAQLERTIADIKTNHISRLERAIARINETAVSEDKQGGKEEKDPEVDRIVEGAVVRANDGPKGKGARGKTVAPRVLKRRS